MKMVLCLGVLMAVGCRDRVGVGDMSREWRRLRLATTTSFDNSGLLGKLLPPFEERYGVRVEVVAVGTGKALELGANGDVDVLIVHDPAGEKEFVAAGLGVNHRSFMHSDFFLVGPGQDPAGVAKVRTAAGALAAVAAAKASFVSRGDDSGTHRKERRLWKIAGIEPAGSWYIEGGQDMAATLVMADEKQAYTLTDRGTYLAFKDKLKLSVVVQGDPELGNPYSIIAVNPALWPNVNYLDAMLLVAWVTSAEGQGIIGSFRKGGEQLFVPDAVPPKE